MLRIKLVTVEDVGDISAVTWNAGLGAISRELSQQYVYI